MILVAKELFNVTRPMNSNICIFLVEADLSVFQWIETWYNTNRKHSRLGNKLAAQLNSLSENHGQVH